MAKHHLVLILAQRGGIPSRADFSFSKTVSLCTVLRPRSVQHALFLVQILSFKEIFSTNLGDGLLSLLPHLVELEQKL